MDAVDGQTIANAMKQIKSYVSSMSSDEVKRVTNWVKQVAFFEMEYGSAIDAFQRMFHRITDTNLIYTRIHQRLWAISTTSNLYFVQQLYVELRSIIKELIGILHALETKTMTRGWWWWKKTEPIQFSQLPLLESYLVSLEFALNDKHPEFYDRHKIEQMFVCCHALRDSVREFIFS